MTQRTAIHLHACLLAVVSGVASRLRGHPERGQGTVEYVALILLVAGVLAAAVGAARSTNFDLATTVKNNINNAVQEVNGGNTAGRK